MLTAGIPRALARAPSLAALAAGLLALMALAALAWSLTRSPAAAALPAPPALDRMLGHVSVLAAEPRPIATETNAQARDYILAQLRAMGLAPSVQQTTVQKAAVQFWGGTHVTVGRVHNIVVHLPGRAPDRLERPALLLAAHYDSGKESLGAARGAAQVAAMLETAWALGRAGHLNDIVLLFADGEEVGGLGAKGFAEQHPLARRIGLTLKFDGAGSAGPLLLYDSANADGATLRGWVEAVPGVDGSSLRTRLLKLLPDTPRIGPLAAIPAPALLFVNTGMPFGGAHHLDSVERLDPAMLAQLGESMLRLTRHFGDADLARGTHQPHAFFTLPAGAGIQHPAILGWGLAALCGLMLVRAYHKASEGAETTVAPLVQGFFGVALLLLAVRMLLWERREELAALTRMQDSGAAVVFLAAGGCLFIGALYLLRRLVGATPVFLGTMAWLTAALVLLLLAALDAAYMLAWPLAAALGAYTALQSPRRAAVRVLVLAAGLAPALLLLVPALRESWTALAPHGLYVPTLAIALMLLCFASLFLLLPLGRLVGAGLAVALAACAVLPGQASGPAPQEQARLQPNRLVYFKDMNSWRAYWLLPPEPLDAWSKQLFPNLDKPSIYVDVFGWHSPRQWFAIAPRDDGIAFPEATMLKNPRLAAPSLNPPLRRMEFTLRSKNRAPHVELVVAGVKPHRSSLNGRVLTSMETALSLSLYGMEDQLLRFTLDAPNDDPLAVMIEERIPGLPEHLLPPGAPARMPGTGMTVSADVLRFH